MNVFIRKCSKRIFLGPCQGLINWRSLSFQGSQDASYLRLPTCVKRIPAIWRALVYAFYPSVLLENDLLSEHPLLVILEGSVFSLEIQYFPSLGVTG